MKKKSDNNKKDLVALYERFRDLVIADARKSGKAQRAEYLTRWGRLSTWDRIPVRGAGRVNFLEALRAKGLDVEKLLQDKVLEVRWINKRPLIYVDGLKLPEPERGARKRGRGQETGYDF